MANIDYGIAFQDFIAGTSGAFPSITKVATSGKSHYITDIIALSTDNTAILNVVDATNGTIFGIKTGTVLFERSFVQHLMATQGEALTISFSVAGTAEINILGYTI